MLINGVMALTRANAHAILDRVSPPVLLTGCVAVAGVGLLGLSFAQGLVQTVVAALVFAIGISVVWPTMMGFVAERAPRTGALGLGLMAAVGSLAVGVVTTPLLGRVADSHLLDAIPPAAVRAVAADAQGQAGPLKAPPVRSWKGAHRPRRHATSCAAPRRVRQGRASPRPPGRCSMPARTARACCPSAIWCRSPRWSACCSGRSH
ncbi:MFS transporter [Rhizorhabdus histidinilytica]